MREAITTDIPFGSINPQQDKLFAVRAGVSAKDALEHASCLLSVALDIRHEAIESSSATAWASAYLTEMAKAAIDAATSGMLQAGEVDHA
jgi:hypothetical protein